MKPLKGGFPSNNSPRFADFRIRVGKLDKDLLLGIARALTADNVGIIGDTAQSAANLARMGYGYLGHKAGLLRADQMPEPLSGLPLTAEWFAKGTPLQDPGTPNFSRGQVVGGFLPLATAVAAKIKPQHGKINSIFSTEDFINKRGLDVSSDAKIDLPTGETLRPIQTHPEYGRLIDRTSPSMSVAEVFPDLTSKIPELGQYNIVKKPMSLNDLGAFDKWSKEISLNSILPASGPTGLLSVNQHEVNHLFQELNKAVSRGANAGTMQAVSQYRPGGSMLQKAAPEFAAEFPALGQQRLDKIREYHDFLTQTPGAAYLGNQGEVGARVGQMFAIHPELASKKNVESVFQTQTTKGRTGFHVPITSAQGTSVMLPPEIAQTLVFKEGKVYEPSTKTLIGFYDY